jgi:hypothetical protein
MCTGVQINERLTIASGVSASTNVGALQFTCDADSWWPARARSVSWSDPALGVDTRTRAHW